MISKWIDIGNYELILHAISNTRASCAAYRVVVRRSVYRNGMDTVLVLVQDIGEPSFRSASASARGFAALAACRFLPVSLRKFVPLALVERSNYMPKNTYSTLQFLRHFHQFDV